MATNRYSKPAQQTIMDTYVAMPYKEMLLAGQAQQTQLDELDANRIALGDKEFYNLEKDDETAAMAREWLSTESAKIADLYGTNMGGAKSAYRNLEREAKKRFGQSGDIGAMDANYKAKAAYREKLEEAEVDPRRIEGLMREASNSYEGIGKGGEYGRYNIYGGQRAANNYNYVDWVTTNLSDLEAITGAYADTNADGEGYIWKKKGTDEVVSNERIQQAAMQLARGDENLLYNIAEGDRLGLGSSDAFKSAVAGGGTKYAYTKKTRDKTLSSDATALRAMDKADELEANKVSHLEDTSAFVDMNNDTPFVGDMKENYTKIEETQAIVDSLNTELQSYLLKDAEGNVVYDNNHQAQVNPDYATNYDLAQKSLDYNQRELEKAANNKLLQEKTYLEAVQEVTGMDASGEKIIKMLPGGNLLLEDKEKLIAFKDENGNTIDPSEYGFNKRDEYGSPSVDNDEYAWAAMAEYGLKPVYGIKTMEISGEGSFSAGEARGTGLQFSQQGRINQVLNERKAKSEDFMIDYYTSSDFKLSPQTQAIKEDLIDNLGVGMDIMVTNSKNQLVKASNTVRDKVAEYADLSTYKAQLKVLEDEELKPEDKATVLKMLDVIQKSKSVENWRENAKLIGTTRGPDGYALIEDPQGNRIALKPSNPTTRASYNRMIQNSDKQIYIKTGDEVFKNRGLSMKYPEKYEELKELKADMSEQKSMSEGKNLNKKPVALANGYYMHVVRGKNPALLQIWLSESSYQKDQPSAGDTRIEQISTSLLDQKGLNLMEASTQL